MKHEYKDFDEFITWLKKDGLKPKTSERLWRKKIFSNLNNGHKKSIDNYKDFQLFKKLNSLLGIKVKYKNINSLIFDTKIEHTDCLLIMQDGNSLRIALIDFDSFIDKYIYKENKWIE